MSLSWLDCPWLSCAVWARVRSPTPPSRLGPSPKRREEARAIQQSRASSLPVLLVADLFQPVDDLPVELLLDGDVRHRGGRGGSMPVLLAGREPDHVTGADLLDRSTFALGPATAGRDDEGLAERMGVPRGPRARLEGDAGALHECRIGCLEERVDPHGAGEPLCRSPGGGPRAIPRDLHSLCSSGSTLTFYSPNRSNRYASSGPPSPS